MTPVRLPTESSRDGTGKVRPTAEGSVAWSHCTVNVTVVVREEAPAVAVTVIVEVPAGVPPPPPGGGPAEPHPAISKQLSASNAPVPRNRRAARSARRARSANRMAKVKRVSHTSVSG